MEVWPKRIMDIWFTEKQSPNMKLSLRIKNILLNKTTEFQDILVVETEEYGKIMVLDGAIQITEKDEFCYHEMMAHIPICAHSHPRRVLIIGGGDGGVLRECLKHPFIEEAILVDIDSEVVQASRDYFPHVSSGMNDPRATILNMDALTFIREHKHEFDIVIVDSTDPVDFAAGLFQSPFYTDVFEALRSEGIMIAQTESPFAEASLLKQAYKEMEKVFPIVSLCWGAMPTYPTGFWTYTVGSKTVTPEEPRNPAPLDCKYYTSRIHSNSFVLPPFLEALIELK
ncbi:MAG: polyamine aminopropyltransferase [Synergistales bacterium]|nr:polyamine aminopropyltransferase [Synergistales bacterium]